MELVPLLMHALPQQPLNVILLLPNIVEQVHILLISFVLSFTFNRLRADPIGLETSSTTVVLGQLRFLPLDAIVQSEILN